MPTRACVSSRRIRPPTTCSTTPAARHATTTATAARDIFLVNWFQGDHCHLLRNESPANHWLDVTVEGLSFNHMGIGSRIQVFESGRAGDPDALLGMHEINIGTGYASGHTALAHFGLANHKSSRRRDPLSRVEKLASWKRSPPTSASIFQKPSRTIEPVGVQPFEAARTRNPALHTGPDTKPPARPKPVPSPRGEKVADRPDEGRHRRFNPHEPAPMQLRISYSGCAVHGPYTHRPRLRRSNLPPTTSRTTKPSSHSPATTSSNPLTPSNPASAIADHPTGSSTSSTTPGRTTRETPGPSGATASPLATSTTRPSATTVHRRGMRLFSPTTARKNSHPHCRRPRRYRHAGRPLHARQDPQPSRPRQRRLAVLCHASRRHSRNDSREPLRRRLDPPPPSRKPAPPKSSFTPPFPTSVSPPGCSTLSA